MFFFPYRNPKIIFHALWRRAFASKKENDIWQSTGIAPVLEITGQK
jgi:hypothetical protein